jgi:hypothetical protein
VTISKVHPILFGFSFSCLDDYDASIDFYEAAVSHWLCVLTSSKSDKNILFFLKNIPNVAHIFIAI